MKKIVPIATCINCNNNSFFITEEEVVCNDCGKKYPFQFIDDAKILCETKANDILKMIEDME